MKKEVITIKTDLETKDFVVNEAKKLGVSISEFGDICLKQLFNKQENDSSTKLEIDKLNKNITQLTKDLQDQEHEIELSKKIKENNEGLKNTITTLNKILSSFENMIEELKNENFELKEMNDKLQKKEAFQNKNESGVKVGFTFFNEL